jgi:hypothetical protein
MAKGIGLIGNFRGKVGNMVGYNLKDSNNKQTQGVRVYQPIVKNPKTAAQAEQRAKLLAVNATYRALKMVIDRGNESLPYGNKSRLAWLKSALKSTKMPWYEKGAIVACPVGGPLTKGSLISLSYSFNGVTMQIACSSVTSSTAVNTIGTLSAAILAGYPSLKKGDQITFVVVFDGMATLTTKVFSIVLDDTDTTAIEGFSAGNGAFSYEFDDDILAGAIIVSRLGDNGEHLRSTEVLDIVGTALNRAPYDADSKAAAIASYRASDAASGDWAEESIQ